jgi:hypothetical protein
MRLLLLAALLPGCRAADVQAYNLDQLHGPDGQHHFSGSLENSLEYYFRHVILPALGDTTGSWSSKSPSPIADPAEECLQRLLELEELDIGDRYNRAVSIQWSARLAVDDGSMLSRERALYVLARAAAPLGHILPLPAPKDRPLAGPEALSRALGALVAASRPLLGMGEWNATAEAELGASVELVRALNLDLDGARRALDVSCKLALRAGWKGRGAGIAQLVEDLERVCVSRAIAHGLADDAPRTQAAAIEASEAVAGHSVLAGLLLQGAARAETPALVLERILMRLRLGGLVEHSDEPGAPPPAELHEAQLRALWRIVLGREEPALRVAAMSALGAVSGAGFASLREEDWMVWWELRAPTGPGQGAPP